ncbi:MAG: hypothetical protein JJT89_02115 [Nitriliruptoraceae bacterium]|nr:hypothetical protein [Nitriliruptoraceae bacterium]
MSARGASEDDAGSESRSGPRVTRTRSLPGGRAVVGALLITAAAVATFAAYLNATAEPTTQYLVATEAVEPGTRFASAEELRAVLGTANLELIGPMNDRAIPVEELEQLVGRVLLAPLAPGDLVSRTTLVADGGVPDAQTLSFSLPRTAAVAGTLRAGERVDVLATVSEGGDTYTAYVARGVPLLSVGAPDGGPLGSGSEVLFTVAVADLADVQALGHAINTADVFLTRSVAGPGDDVPAPGPFRVDPAAPGPLPEGATSITPGGEVDRPDDGAGDEPDEDVEGDG